MRRHAVLLIAAANLASGCNSGDAIDDIACGTNRTCPPGYVCLPTTNKCVRGSSGTDARVDGRTDAALRDAGTVDASTVDARLVDGSTSPDARSPDAAPPDAAVPPVTTLTPGFDAATPTNAANVSFTFTAQVSGATFECRVDTAAFAACASPLTLSPAEGTHILTVRARAGGLTEANPPSVTFAIDRTPPTFTLTGADDDAATGRLTVRYTVRPAGDAAGLTFTTCSLDGLACTCGPASAICSQVAAGEHVFSVAARDAAMNPGPIATSATPLVMSYGPGAGRAVLMGHDFAVVGEQPRATLRGAFSEVPFVLRGLSFTRKIRLAVFESASVDATEAANALDVVAGLYDSASVARIRGSSAKELDDALRSRDLLLVFDQKDASMSAAAGSNWQPALQRFLDAGGVVVVLDGLTGRSASETFQVLAAGGLIGVVSAAPIEPLFVDEVNKVLTPTEIVDGDVSPLAPPGAAAKYSAPDHTVVFSDPGTVPQRWIYQRNGEVCSDGCDPIFDPVIIEKVFPAYAVDVSFPQDTFEFGLGSPNVPITVGTTPADAGLLRFDCSYVVTDCQAAPCSSSCPTGASGEFRSPSAPAEYDLEIRLVDPRGQAGEGFRTQFRINPINLSDTLPFADMFVICVRDQTFPRRNLVYTVTKTTGAGSAAFPFTAPSNEPVCGDPLPVSLSVRMDERCSPFGNLAYTITATDDGGNVLTVVPYSFSTACP